MQKLGLVTKDTTKDIWLQEQLGQEYILETIVLEQDKCPRTFMDRLMFTIRILGKDSKQVHFYNSIYEVSKTCLYKSILIRIARWQDLRTINASYLQLVNCNITFLLAKVPDEEVVAFNKLVKGIGKFWNLHICVQYDSKAAALAEEYYNVHNLQKEKLSDIVKLYRNNKRKYIGFKYHLNELRQKIKLNYDLIYCCLKIKLSKAGSPIVYDTGKPIPKVLHYCWFGRGDQPKLVKKCIASWKKVLPDYTIKCWNEDNFPYQKYPFAQEALAKHKWAFMADVARLHALYHEGGIYLDTDVELLKSLDGFLDEDGFTGYESLNLIAMALVGAKPHHPWIADMLVWYSCVHCDDDYTEIANTKIVSKLYKWIYDVKLKGQEVLLPNKVHIFPREYFSPENLQNGWATTENTYCIHHFTGMW